MAIKDIKDATVRVKLRADLRREIAKIAADDRRTFSNTFRLLLERGLRQFKRDGLLNVNSTPRKASR